MLLALFLVLNGIAAQEPQAGLVDKLDKLLAGQELQETAEFAARKANSASSHRQSIHAKIEESEQTLAARLDSVILEVQSVELIIQAATGFNKTLNQLVEENKTLKGRQAAAAALQVCQFFIAIIYLLVIGISCLVKCFKKKQEQKLVENLELMKSHLQERKKLNEVCRQATKGTVVLTSWSENSASKE